MIRAAGSPAFAALISLRSSLASSLGWIIGHNQEMQTNRRMIANNAAPPQAMRCSQTRSARKNLWLQALFNRGSGGNAGGRRPEALIGLGGNFGGLDGVAIERGNGGGWRKRAASGMGGGNQSGLAGGIGRRGRGSGGGDHVEGVLSIAGSTEDAYSGGKSWGEVIGELQAEQRCPAASIGSPHFSQRPLLSKSFSCISRIWLVPLGSVIKLNYTFVNCYL